MLFALGIPWIFGYLMLISKNKTAKELFAVIFSITNSFQVSYQNFKMKSLICNLCCFTGNSNFCVSLLFPEKSSRMDIRKVE